jgi:5,5'-dehydrodivanillate O-demethylase
MITAEENEMMTRVGKGTPAGELLRRYWYPVTIAAELTHENPTLFVRMLGEDLVIFMDKSGRVGLLADKCSHRNASLVYGRVEERGISCAYHGWLYDCEGTILETPPERNDAIMKSVKQLSYPVKKYAGLYWTYMGPAPVPELPRFDVYERKDGTRKVIQQPQLDCNWLQAMENSMDPAHTAILHQNAGGRMSENTTRGRIDDVQSFDFFMVPYGIMKLRTLKTGHAEYHPVIFPNVLRHHRDAQIRVPIDDTHTRIYFVQFDASKDGAIVEDDEPTVIHIPSYKEPADKIHPFAKYSMEPVQPQDHMAWETQGPISDRTQEHLSFSDRGVALYRKVLRENIALVQEGKDPMGVIRDPDHEMINTNLDASLDLFNTQRNAPGRTIGARQLA